MAGKLMHAVQYFSHGGGAAALKHVEVPIPEPKGDEVLLKVEAASLNPMDYRIQMGIVPFFPRKFPAIPGTNVAGEVVLPGSSTSKFKAGDKVIAYLSHSNGGALAEYVVAKENITVIRPPEVSADVGAGIPLAAMTAHYALTQSANINLNGTGDLKNILITAASGGVGHYAVQLAKLGNTHVTATCGTRNLNLVRSLGADEVIDYTTPEGAALKSPSGKKYDYVVHCATGFPWSRFEPNLSTYGKVIDLTPGLNAMLTFVLKNITFSKKKLVPSFVKQNTENLKYLVNLVKEGKVKTVVDSKHALSKAEDGWAKMMDGHATGKIIIEP
ncbi:quinone-oxidoreductase homolog, chloroplastic-like [Silene latifolia]|uniref:quinone-oxidoreductase homolog, chloroplastic-like n=1 Tax=Silene latifolia TaxID=37657 RepID=UPI003D78A525